MILGFRTIFPDGTPTGFPAKIMLGLEPSQITDLGRLTYNQEVAILKAQGVSAKIHTVRSSDRWKQNDVINFVNGARTKAYLEFARAFCVDTRQVKMYQHLPNSKIQVYVDDSLVDINTFLINDGFVNYHSFHEWFSPLIQKELKNGKHFYQGQLILWKEYQYV